MKKELLSKPEKLLMKEPFFRGLEGNTRNEGNSFDLNAQLRVSLPSVNKKQVTQEQFMKELDQYSHKVLYDDNVPSIYMKLNDGNYCEIKYQKSAIPFQKKILSKQALHLCAKNITLSHINQKPSEKERNDFIKIKEGWVITHQQHAFFESVVKQKSLGDTGLLYYTNKKGKIKFKILSYDLGYVLCPHYDENGELMLMAVYYSKNGKERIDCYDDSNIYSYERNDNQGITDGDWRKLPTKKHGFEEIPICYMRENDVCWGDSQLEIETTEILWNIASVIMKRNGWGVLFVKGTIDEKARKIAGNVIMQAKGGPDGATADAKMLNAPTPEGLHEHIDKHINFIQLGSSTTFVQPSDIKVSGKTSGLTIKLMMTMDLECALDGALKWTPFVNKMLRLFAYGYAKELVFNNQSNTAITDFSSLNINATPSIWMPQSETEMAQTLVSLVSNNIVSRKTATEQLDFINPDEDDRIADDLKRLKEAAEKSVTEKTEVNPPKDDNPLN